MINNKTWLANQPFSQSKTELQRAQLSEVGSKEPCAAGSALGPRLWSMCDLRAQHHSQMESAGSQFCWRTKTGVPEKNPRSQIEIDKSQSTCGAQDSIPGPQRWEARALPPGRTDSLKRGLKLRLRALAPRQSIGKIQLHFTSRGWSFILSASSWYYYVFVPTRLRIW